jgi:uncharacterized protein (TIGR02300 family)
MRHGSTRAHLTLPNGRKWEAQLEKKAELGTKRICPSCAARFYDLTKRPIVCPKCQTSFEPETLLKPRRQRPEAREVPVPVPVKVVEEEEAAAEEDELDDEEEALEDDEVLEPDDEVEEDEEGTKTPPASRKKKRPAVPAEDDLPLPEGDEEEDADLDEEEEDVLVEDDADLDEETLDIDPDIEDDGKETS